MKWLEYLGWALACLAAAVQILFWGGVIAALLVLMALILYGLLGPLLPVLAGLPILAALIARRYPSRPSSRMRRAP